MPALIAAGIIGAGSLGSGLLGYFGSQKASDQQANANAQALQFQKQVYAQNQANLNPFISTGTSANYTLGSLYGLNPGQGGKPDYSSFSNSPDYNFAFSQGQNATQNLLSAKGNLMSGGGLTALTNWGQGLASQQFQNYVGRLQQLSQGGQQAASSLAGNSVASGNQIGNTFGALGTAQASGTIGGANALGGALGGIGNAALLGSILGKNSNTSSYGGQPGYQSGLNYDQSGNALPNPTYGP